MFARIDADQGGAIMDHRITFAEPLDDSQRRLVDPRKFDRPVQRMPGVPLQSVCDGFSEADAAAEMAPHVSALIRKTPLDEPYLRNRAVRPVADRNEVDAGYRNRVLDERPILLGEFFTVTHEAMMARRG